MRVQKYLPDGAQFWWFVMCLFTLGGCYFLKVIIMKAIIDSQEKN